MISLCREASKFTMKDGFLSLHAYRWMGWLFLGIGGIGILLPGLPTVVFWIIAAWAFGRGDPRIRDRIYAHPRFGVPVMEFLEHGVLRRRGKIFATLGILMGATLSLWLSTPPDWALWLMASVLIPVLIWLLTRPSRLPMEKRSMDEHKRT